MKQRETVPGKPWFQAALFALGMICLVFSGQLLAEHLAILREVKDVSVPLVAQLRDLENRERALEEQVELAQIQSALELGSVGEKLDAYVLPREADFGRLIAVFDLLEEFLGRAGTLSTMSDITIGAPLSLEEHVAARPLSVHFAVHGKGVEQILLFVRMAGLLTVGDALSDEELDLLLSASEQENSTGIVALEQFLSRDLLRYGREPKPHEEQLRRSFTSPGFEKAFQSALQSPMLNNARRVFEGDFGRTLEENKLWPIQFMTIREVKLEDGGAEGWYKLSLDLLVWEKSS